LSTYPQNGAWLLAQPDAQDQIRLFCFPYAGGGASVYRGWKTALPPAVGVYPVQLPGRENRMAEPALCDMGELVPAIAAGIAGQIDRPFVLFGHSMGARIAFELARHLRQHRGVQPCHLIVAGSRAAHMREPQPLHHLPPDEFVQELRRFSATPEELLQHKELMELFLPTLRADFTVDETYVCAEAAPLDCPITAFGGTEDAEAGQNELAAWASYTRAEFSLEMIPGDHFFLRTNGVPLLRSLARILNRHLVAQR